MILDHIQPRIVQLGCIKIGGRAEKELLTAEAKRKNLTIDQARAQGMTWSPPEKHDHFTITTMNRDQRGRLCPDEPLMNTLAKDEDKKVRRIPVRLLGNDLETTLQSSFCWYGGRRIGARAEIKFVDGELRPTEITWFNEHTGENAGKPLASPRTEPWKDEMLEYTNARGEKLLKVHTCLNVAIAAAGTRFGGVYRFRTTSQITTSQLYGGLLGFQSLTGGVLVGLPFILALRPMQVQPKDKNGQPVSSTVYVVHLELHATDMKQIQDQAMEQARYMVTFQDTVQSSLRAYKRMLAAPGHESDPAEVADIEDEFQPPEHGQATGQVPMPRAVEPDPVEPDPTEHEEIESMQPA